MKAKVSLTPARQVFADVKQEIGSVAKQTANSLTRDLGQEVTEDFFRQLLGDVLPQKTEKSVSGEFSLEKNTRGEIKLDRVFVSEQLVVESQIAERQKIQEIQLVVQNLQAEVITVAKQVGKETNLPLEYIPAPGTYHINFLEKVLGLLKLALKFVRGARENIENSASWLLAATGRKKRGPLGVQVWTRGKQMKVHEHASMAILQG